MAESPNDEHAADAGPRLFVVFLGGDLPEGRIGEGGDQVDVDSTYVR
ncbi:MAG: hypothetical protein ACYC2O_09950 [Microthrixaceae bacterium]